MDDPLFDAAFDTPRGKGPLADALLDAIRREAEDERIVWLGPGIPRGPGAAYVLLMGVMHLAIACLVSAMSLDHRRPDFWPSAMKLTAFIFVSQVAINALNAGWLRRARRGMLVGYALTDRRAIIAVVDRRRWSSGISYRFEDLGRPRRVDARDGLGDLIFTARPRPISESPRLRPPRPGFYGIPEAREAEAILLRLQDAREATRGQASLHWSNGEDA